MNEKELKALISLLDDPDQDIFNHVEQQLLTCGPEAIPFLEEYWESSYDPISQNRTEIIIHKIQFDQLKNDIQLWVLQNQEDLLEGLLIINRYQFPNLDENKIHFQIAELRRNVWFELMYEMSPVEKVKLLNNIIFREFGLSGNTENYHAPENSFISSVLESKKGNPISLTCIYTLIAQKLDIPIAGINLPKHFIAAYIEENKPLFYVNAFNKGQIMKIDDVYSFLRQLNIDPKESYTLPCDHIDIIRRVIRNLVTAYENKGDDIKKQEMNMILKLLEDNK